jgi:sugar O-acyltransferase (sialic acid O-acetyltransferase NeuD family)
MTRSLVIIGTGGGAHDVLDIVDAINAVSPCWDVAGFLDDVLPTGSSHSGLSVLGPLNDALRFRQHEFVNIIGSEHSFRKLPAILSGCGLPAEKFATLIHPLASVSARARLGHGVVVNHGVSVGGGARIGDFVTLGPGCTIGHDTVIGTHSIVAPGAIVSGFVRVGSSCYLGAGCVIKQRLAIGNSALIGMGAVVVRNVAAGQTVIGNPARPYWRSSDPSTPEPSTLNSAVELDAMDTETRKHSAPELKGTA